MNDEGSAAIDALKRMLDDNVGALDLALAPLRAVLESMHDGVMVYDAQGTPVAWNATALAMYGFASIEERRRPLRSFEFEFEFRTVDGLVVDPQDWPLRRLLRGERFSDLELSLSNARTNRVRLISYGGRAIRDASGEIVLVVLTHHDITQRRDTELALRRSESRFRQLADTMSNLAWSANPDGWIHWYNRRWYEYTGTTPEQMAGWGWQSVHDPEYLPLVTNQWQASLASGKAFEMEFPLRGADGSFRMFLTRVEPLRDDDGQITQWFGTNTDIEDQRRATEALKASEARLRAVLEATPECVKIVGPDGDLLYMNRAGLDMIECDREEAVRGRSVYNLIVPPHRSEWTDHHKRVCRGEKLSWEFEIEGLRGGKRWMSTQAVPLLLPDGRYAQLAVTRDATDRRRRDEEREALLEAEREARATSERMSRLKDEFLSTLSHELRTPLNAILGWAQLLRGGQLSPQHSQQAVDTIERNAKAQTKLIEDLLDMSRIISGKVRLDVQRVELSEVVEAAIDSVLPTAQAKGVRVERALDPYAGPVSGDPNRLQQVVWNLLSNAIKFTPAGGKVQVLLERVNSHLEISVSDTGVGIRPDFLPFVFERFRQADGATTRQFGGLGLGLAIVKQLVEMHNGQVRAKSQGEGQGATFSVALPLAVIHRDNAEARQHPTASQSHDVLEEPPFALDGLKILIVDDEPDARALLERVLQDRRAQVLTAADATEALEIVPLERPDLIISDIGMPRIDGYEFIRRVRALGPQQGGSAPAIAVTAFARSEDRRRALIAGYQSHICKPMEAIELVTVVASLTCRLDPQRYEQ